MTLTDLAPLVVTETEIHELDEAKCENSHTDPSMPFCAVAVTHRYFTCECIGGQLVCQAVADSVIEHRTAYRFSRCGLCGRPVLDCWRVVPV